MSIELSTPGVDELSDVVRALREWQYDDSSMQLHPGDLGWFWRFGADATAAAVRAWKQAGQILAIGLLDGADVLRLTVAPEAQRNDSLARQVVVDVANPERGVLPPGRVSIETPNGTLVQDHLLTDAGWDLDEPWTPLRRDLTEPVEEPMADIQVIGPEQASEYTAVHRSSFGSPGFTDELWEAMAGGLPYADARSLLAYNERGIAVAEVTVWSAGPGKPGLLEPMGVHADHRGRGYGKAICVAAAAELQRLGSSSAIVCTPTALAAAVATYESAGFQQLPQRLDRSRNA